MQDEMQEKYVFNRIAHADFEECSQMLELLQGIENQQVKLAIIKSAIIAYYRPFSGSNPIHRERKWKLDTDFITDQVTHTKVEECRMHLIAHSDLEYRNPTLGKLGSLYPISFKGFYYKNYIDLVIPLQKLASEMLSVLAKKIKEYELENF